MALSTVDEAGDPVARQACSARSFVDDRLRRRPTYEGSLVIVRATP